MCFNLFMCMFRLWASQWSEQHCCWGRHVGHGLCWLLEWNSASHVHNVLKWVDCKSNRAWVHLWQAKVELWHPWRRGADMSWSSASPACPTCPTCCHWHHWHHWVRDKSAIWALASRRATFGTNTARPARFLLGFCSVSAQIGQTWHMTFDTCWSCWYIVIPLCQMQMPSTQMQQITKACNHQPLQRTESQWSWHPKGLQPMPSEMPSHQQASASRYCAIELDGMHLDHLAAFSVLNALNVKTNKEIMRRSLQSPHLQSAPTCRKSLKTRAKAPATSRIDGLKDPRVRSDQWCW